MYFIAIAISLDVFMRKDEHLQTKLPYIQMSLISVGGI